MENKKGLEAPSNLMVIVMFIVLLAIIVIIALFFGGNIRDSSAFQATTNFTQGFRW